LALFDGYGGAGAAFPGAADSVLRAALLRTAVRLQLRAMKRDVVVSAVVKGVGISVAESIYNARTVFWSWRSSVASRAQRV